MLAGALYVDFLAAVIAYWMTDTSPEASDTAQLVDLALQVGVLVLRSGLPHRLLELGGFMLRSQMVRLLQPGGSVVIEHGDDQAPSALEALRTAGFVQATSHRDLTGRARYVTALRPSPAVSGLAGEPVAES